MGAMFADECDLAACIAEGHQVFAEQPHAYRRAIAARQIVGRDCGYPITPEQFAHRSAGARSRQKLIFFTLHWGLIVAALYERRQSSNSEIAGGQFGAMVTAKHTESGLTRTVTTNENGDYRMPSLAVGAYEVTAEILGFKPLILN